MSDTKLRPETQLALIHQVLNEYEDDEEIVGRIRIILYGVPEVEEDEEEIEEEDDKNED